MTLEVSWSFTVWKKKRGEGKGKTWVGSALEAQASVPTVCLQADASQDGGVCVKETPKGIPEGQHRGPSFPWPWAGLTPQVTA